MSLIWLKAMIVAKGVNFEQRTVEGFASTSQPDMIRDVILPTAWKKSLARWKKRGSMPKFLAYHMHRLLTGHSPVLGPMLSMKVVPEGLMLKAEFAETELGNEHLHLYSIGAMDYFSVGFQIMKNGSTMHLDTVRQLLRENKIKAKVPEEVDRVIFEAEILETSAVVLGANLAALVTATAEGRCGMCGDECAGKCKTPEEKATRAMYAKRILERLEKCAAIIPDGAGKAVHTDPEKFLLEEPKEFNGIWLPAGIDEKAHPLADVVDGAEEAGDGPPPAETPGRNVADDPENVAARRRIAEESADDIGEGIEELVHPKLMEGEVTDTKATQEGVDVTIKAELCKDATVVDPLLETKRVIPFRDYGYVESEGTAWDGGRERRAASVEDLKKMCAWVDAEHDDTKGAYKLPHHRQSDTKAIWRGVSAAMGALLGARGGTQIPDGERRGVYNHLKKHYVHWDKEAPEFRDYTADELKSLEDEGKIISQETLEAEQRGVDRDLMLSILERVEALEARETEREKESKTFLETLAAAVEANADKSGGSGSHEHQTDPPEGESGETGEGGGEADGMKILNGILGNLEKLSGPKPGS